MTKNKMAVLAIAGLTVLGGASGAFASPGGNGKGLRVGQCTLSADQLQTADTSPVWSSSRRGSTLASRPAR